MTNHTQGPWYVTASDSDGAMVVADNNVMIANWPTTFKAEQYPNARLIAAAPELLAVLQTIAATKGLEERYSHMLRDVRAAIANATGETK